MLSLIIPSLVGAAVDLITDDIQTKKAIVQIAVENPVMVAASVVSIPGMVLEFFLRRVKSKKRLGCLTMIKKALHYTEIAVKYLKEAVDYIDKQGDKVIKQNLK